MQNLYVIILCAQVERVWAYIRDSAKETAVITTELADIGQTLSQLHATLNSSFQVTLFISIGDHTLNYGTYAVYVPTIIVARVFEWHN